MHHDTHRITRFYVKSKALARRAFSGCPGAAPERIALSHATYSEMPRLLKRSAKLSRRGALVNNCSFYLFCAFDKGCLLAAMFSRICESRVFAGRVVTRTMCLEPARCPCYFFIICPARVGEWETLRT